LCGGVGGSGALHPWTWPGPSLRQQGRNRLPTYPPHTHLLSHPRSAPAQDDEEGILELAAQLAGLQSAAASRRATREVGPGPGIMRPSDFGSTGGTPQLSRQMSAMMSVSGPGARAGGAGGAAAAARPAADAWLAPGCCTQRAPSRPQPRPPNTRPPPAPSTPLPPPCSEPDGLDSLPEELLAFSLADARVGVLSVRGRKVTDTRPRRPGNGMIANMELVATAIASVGALVFLGDADGSLVVWDTQAGKSSMLTTGWALPARGGGPCAACRGGRCLLGAQGTLGAAAPVFPSRPRVPTTLTPRPRPRPRLPLPPPPCPPGSAWCARSS
jgi:hypothetical protein